uniref:ELM2 domain-containing protein n=1 Tax=Heterorhabditis bacteriophora TaxID=37862 RepID=A0A1I7XS92_HETBA
MAISKFEMMTIGKQQIDSRQELHLPSYANEVNWVPYPHQCIPPKRDGISFADESAAKAVVEATKYVIY